MSAADAEPKLDRAEVLGVLVPACITHVYAEAPTISSVANMFTLGKSPLRQACHDFQQLAEAGAEAGAMSAELVEIATRVFRLACDNKTSKLCDPALEGLRLLFATGLVQGATEGWAPKVHDASPEPSSSSPAPSADPTPSADDIERERALSSLVISVAKCAEVNVSSTHVACVACVLAAHASDGCAVRGDALAQLCRSTLHLAVAAAADRDRTAARRALVRVINETFARAGLTAEPPASGSVTPSVTSVTRPTSTSDRESDEDDVDVDVVVQPGSRESDALLLTLTLCAVAAKPLDGNNDEYKSHARVLAMDLVRQLLEGPSAATWLRRWRSHLRKPLCVAVIRAGAGGTDRNGAARAIERACLKVEGSNPGGSVGANAPAPKVAKALAPLRALARAAFGTMVIRARKSYKREIAALYPALALAPLEDAAGGAEGGAEGAVDPDHQLVALRLVRKLASDPQVLVDVFVNYDCDLNGENLFEATVGALAGAMTPGKGPRQAVRNGALQCVLAMVQSLRVWHARGEGDTAGGGGGGERDGGDDFDPSSASTVDRDDSSEHYPTHPKESPARLDERRGTADSEADKGLGLGFTLNPKPSEADKFHQMKARKASVEAAVTAFNAKPGLGSLAGCPDLDVDDPDAVAAFLLAAKGLDKTAIGELLGGFDDDEVAVMRAFVRLHDFVGNDFDVALRRFMSAFRLPGEAQKIDRLMEAFAAKYCEDNPNVFADPDAAYVLAFAVIMLNTDAHNPNMDTKMTKADFVGMATSAESGASMDVAMLGTIFDRIVGEEIVMKDDTPTAPTSATGKRSSSLGKSLNLATPWARRDTVTAARAKSETVMKKTRDLYAADRGGGGGGKGDDLYPTFHAASEPGLARPMLDAASAPLLDALRNAFEFAEDAGHAALPLECARAAFRLAARLQLPEMRDQLAGFLTSAPGVGAPGAGARMAPQGAEAVMTLLEFAVGESGVSGTCWQAVLEVVSRLDELHAAANGGAGIPTPETDARVQSSNRPIVQSPFAVRSSPGPDRPAAAAGVAGVPAAALSDYPLGPPGASGDLARMADDAGCPKPPVAGGADGGGLNAAERNLAAWLGGAGADAVDRVFVGTARLDSEEIVAFTRALAAVARGELAAGDVGAARTFSLRRLVDVVLHNSGRVRLAWSRVWACASECLVEATSHDDDAVAVAAADGLRAVAARVLSTNSGALSTNSISAEALKPFAAALRARRRDRGHRERGRVAVAEALGAALASSSFDDAGARGHLSGIFPALGVGGWRAALDALDAASDVDDGSGRVAIAALRGLGPAVVACIQKVPESPERAVLAVARFAYPRGTNEEKTGAGIVEPAPVAGPSSAEYAELVELACVTLRDVAVDAGGALAVGESPPGESPPGESPPADSFDPNPNPNPKPADSFDRDRTLGTWRSALRALADVAAGNTPSADGFKPHPKPPPPEPALRAIFSALDAFSDASAVVQLPADAWRVAADVAVRPVIDMDRRRIRLLESTKTSAVGAMRTAVEWSSARASHSLAPLCGIISRLGAGPRRDALLEALLEALPAMAGTSDQELAAHAVSAARHAAASLASTFASSDQATEDERSRGTTGDAELFWDGVVATFASAVASASEKTNRHKTRDETSGGAVAALLAVRAAAETLARAPPSRTPVAFRVETLNLLRDAYHDASAVGAQHGDDRLARLECTAGELLLDALVGELDDVISARKSEKTLKKSSLERDLAGMLRQHVRESLRAAVAVAVPCATSHARPRGDDPGSSRDDRSRDDPGSSKDGSDDVALDDDGDGEVGGSNPGGVARRMGSLDDGGAGWLERAARTRAAASFREPLAAAAIRSLRELAAIDVDLFATCLRECVSFACALVSVGRDPVARELSELFAGPIADVVVPFAASKNIVGRETDGADGEDGPVGAEDGEDGAEDAPATPEWNSPVTSGDDGLDALEPNDEAEETAADPA